MKKEDIVRLADSIIKSQEKQIKDLKKACRLAGFNDFHFHNLRASFISNLAMNNTNPKVIKELARHSDLKITSEHYLADNTMNKSIMEHWADENRNID